MKAVGFSKYLPVDNQNALVAFEAPKPTPGPRDLLVAVKAVSINSVDTKVRRNGVPVSGHRILGWRLIIRSLRSFYRALSTEDLLPLDIT